MYLKYFHLLCYQLKTYFINSPNIYPDVCFSYQVYLFFLHIFALKFYIKSASEVEQLFSIAASDTHTHVCTHTMHSHICTHIHTHTHTLHVGSIVYC